MTLADNPTAIAAEAGRPVPISMEALPPNRWCKEVKIRFGYCDPAGIVFTPRFFDIFNAVVEDWFCEGLGIDYHDIIRRRRMGLGYASAESTFFRPCRMGERITVHVRLAALGRSSLTLQLHAMKDGSEALRGKFTIVITDLEQHRPIVIPDDIRRALGVYGIG